MYQVMALSAIKQAGIPTHRLHADTTTVSFYGEYDTGKMDLTAEEKAELLQIERGYNKDGRPECRQVVVGQIVNEAGIPILQKVQNGSTPDVTWNARAIEYLRQVQEKGFRYGVFVADSKLVTHALVISMNDPERRIPFVSRCPSNFEGKLEERCILKAYRESRWEDMGQFHSGEKAASYRACCFKEEVCGSPMRLLVPESTSLKEKAAASLEKRRQELEAEIKKAEKKVFLCEADAEEETRRFGKLPCSGLFRCRFRIEKETKEKWPRGKEGRGRAPDRGKVPFESGGDDGKGSGRGRIPAESLVHSTDKQRAGRGRGGHRPGADIQGPAGGGEFVQRAEIPGHGIGDLLKEPGKDQGIKYAAVPVIADPCSNPVPDEGRAERNPKRETRCKTACGPGREGGGKANLQAAVRAQRKLLF